MSLLGSLLLSAELTLGAAAPLLPRDLYGDPLPPGAVARLGSTRLRGPGSVTAVAVSPDGRRAYSAHNGHTLCSWDLATGQRLGTWAVRPELSVTSLAVSPDGTSLALVGQGTWAEVRDAERGTIRHVTGVPGPLASSPAFSSDGKRLLFAGPQLRLWEWETGRLRVVDEVPGKAAAFLPDGRAAVAGHGSALMSVSLSEGKPRRLATLSSAIVAVAVTVDGKQALAVDERGVLCVADLISGKEGRRFATGMQIYSTVVAFSRDGRWLAFVEIGRAHV